MEMTPKETAEDILESSICNPGIISLARAYLALLAQVEGMRTEWGLRGSVSGKVYPRNSEADARKLMEKFPGDYTLVSRVIGEWKETK